ncbi:hypothetical protein L596_028398 [Steinernema carpocapsae]|nr:hypothetical protein L596_028398 [Steinernema carpocapsae]
MSGEKPFAAMEQQNIPLENCVDCGGFRGLSSFVYTCIQCSEITKTQTLHCARCVVQFHEGHQVLPVSWSPSSSAFLAMRFLALMQMSKDVKQNAGRFEDPHRFPE